MPSFKLQPIFHNHEEYMITLLRKHTIKKVGAASIREKTMWKCVLFFWLEIILAQWEGHMADWTIDCIDQAPVWNVFLQLQQFGLYDLCLGYKYCK